MAILFNMEDNYLDKNGQFVVTSDIFQLRPREAAEVAFEQLSKFYGCEIF
jgi:hypothetical protein